MAKKKKFVILKGMSRPVSNDFRQIHKLIFGYSDPTSLKLKVRSNGQHVYCDFLAQEHLQSHVKTIPNGLVVSLFEDLAHAALAHEKGKIALIRECQLHVLGPMYANKNHKATVSILKGEGQNLMKAYLKLLNDDQKTVCECEFELFVLTADQIRKMLPDGRIPTSLQHFFPPQRG